MRQIGSAVTSLWLGIATRKVAVISLFLKTNVLKSDKFFPKQRAPQKIRGFIPMYSVIKIKVIQTNFMKFLKKIQHDMSKCDEQKLLVF